MRTSQGEIGGMSLTPLISTEVCKSEVEATQRSDRLAAVELSLRIRGKARDSCLPMQLRASDSADHSRQMHAAGARSPESTLAGRTSRDLTVSRLTSSGRTALPGHQRLCRES